jgi:hypothetical protein
MPEYFKRCRPAAMSHFEIGDFLAQLDFSFFDPEAEEGANSRLGQFRPFCQPIMYAWPRSCGFGPGAGRKTQEPFFELNVAALRQRR